MHQIVRINFENYTFSPLLWGHIPLRHPLSPQSLICAPPLLKKNPASAPEVYPVSLRVSSASWCHCQLQIVHLMTKSKVQENVIWILYLFNSIQVHLVQSCHILLICKFSPSMLENYKIWVKVLKILIKNISLAPVGGCHKALPGVWCLVLDVCYLLMEYCKTL